MRVDPITIKYLKKVLLELPEDEEVSIFLTEDYKGDIKPTLQLGKNSIISFNEIFSKSTITCSKCNTTFNIRYKTKEQICPTCNQLII